MNNRKAEMNRLRWEEKWTLKEIGDKYGVSRERVRQIVGSGAHKNLKAERRRQQAREANEEESNEQLAERLGVDRSTVAKYRRGIYHVADAKDTAVRRHDDCIRFVREILLDRGHEVVLQPTHRHTFDMLVDDRLRASVVLAVAPQRPPTMKTVNPSWHFSLPRTLADNDFVICVTGVGDTFVIPTDKIPPRQSGRRELIFCFPTFRPDMGKYQQYHNRFDLLEGDNNMAKLWASGAMRLPSEESWPETNHTPVAAEQMDEMPATKTVWRKMVKGDQEFDFYLSLYKKIVHLPPEVEVLSYQVAVSDFAIYDVETRVVDGLQAENKALREVALAVVALRDYELSVFEKWGRIINEDISDERFRKMLYELYHAATVCLADNDLYDEGYDEAMRLQGELP